VSWSSLDRELEALLVEVVDDVVLADEVAREADVAAGERLLRLRDHRAGLPPHSQDPLNHVLVLGRVVTGERDHLRDVHALIPHPLDALHHVQERRDQAQVGRDRRLRREQGEDLLVDLEVAPVEPVVVGDDQLRELDVLVLDRLERPLERLADHVEPLERPDLEPAELLLVVEPRLVDHQPTFPVT
jgi:hypothetical protein